MAVDIEALYRRYGPMVLRRCRLLLGDEQEAVDCMHDVFVRVLRRRELLEERGTSSLLYLTATNLSLNRIRSRRRKPSDPNTDLLQTIAHTGADVDRNEARSTLRRLLGGEPESTALIAVLHLHDGLTLQETAYEVGLSVSGVRKRLRRLKVALQTLEDHP